MQKNRVKNILIVIGLMVSLCMLVGKISQYLINYYRGPIYVIDQYINAINNEKYNEIYGLLSKDSLIDIGNANRVATHYKEYYKRDYKLKKIEKRGWLEDKFILNFSFEEGEKKQALSLVNDKGKWKIKFPFELSSVTINAPNGAMVYLAGEQIPYMNGVGYYKEKVLPGIYMVKVAFVEEDISTYYKMIKVPEEQSMTTPYVLGNLQIECIPRLSLSLSPLKITSDEQGAYFENMLVGDYELEIHHPLGYLKPIHQKVQIKQGDNAISIGEPELSDSGKDKLNAFIGDFYTAYLADIKDHTTSRVARYFGMEHRPLSLKVFGEWFIDQKNIQEASLKMKYMDLKINKEGYLECTIIENIELVNKEYNEIEEKEVEQSYKVILYWNTMIDIDHEEWRIVSRNITQSMIAFKDLTGKWVQY